MQRLAEQTLWNELRAIAEAHKNEAQRLITQGSPNPNDSSSNIAAVCVEYYKYLKLHDLYPDGRSDSDSEYVSNETTWFITTSHR